LRDLRRAELVPRGVAGALRLLLPGGAARLVPGGGRRGAGARARRDPTPLRTAARDVAADVGRLADHPAGAAPLVRRGERGRELAVVALGRRPRCGGAP